MISLTPRARYLPLLMLLFSLSVFDLARGQEIARPSQTRTPPEPEAPRPANMHVGKLALNVDAAFETEYVDNVYLSRTDTLSDIILHPQVGIAASWPLTKRNTLRLHTTFGFTKYLENPILDNQQITVSPDSALDFTVYAGDFRFALHDSFAIESETLYSGSLSGVASLPRFTNTAGLSVLWELADVELSVGYDHYNFVTLGSAVTNDQTRSRDLSNLDHSTDQFSALTALNFSWGNAGVEATYSVSSYPENPSADFQSVTAGPYVKWQITRVTSMQASAGYKHYSFEGAPQPVFSLDNNGLVQQSLKQSPGTERDGLYANVAFLNRLNRRLTSRLELGHDDQVDALSGRTQIDFARESLTIPVNARFSLNCGASWQDVQQSAANPLFGEQADNFRLFNATLSTGFRLTPHVTASLGYQITRRFGDDPLRDYTQNRVNIGLHYNF